MKSPSTLATDARSVQNPDGTHRHAETKDRFVKVIWSDTGRHKVEIVGFRRRADVRRLIKALDRHCLTCQVRGLPLDTKETQYPKTGETDAE